MNTNEHIKKLWKSHRSRNRAKEYQSITLKKMDRQNTEETQLHQKQNPYYGRTTEDVMKEFDSLFGRK